MAKKKQPLKDGEKILFGIFGIFLGLAVISYIVLEVVRLNTDKPMFESKTAYVFNELGQRGSKVFREARCTSCHRAMRNGTNMGLNLDGIGSRRDYQWIADFLRKPEATYGSTTFDHGLPPKEAAYVSQMPQEDLDALASFLFGLKAETGSAAARKPPGENSQFIDDMIRMWAPKEWDQKYRDVREGESETGQAPE